MKKETASKKVVVVEGSKKLPQVQALRKGVVTLGSLAKPSTRGKIEKFCYTTLKANKGKMPFGKLEEAIIKDFRLPSASNSTPNLAYTGRTVRLFVSRCNLAVTL